MLRLPLFVPLTVLGLLEPKLVGALPGPGKGFSVSCFFFLDPALSSFYPARELDRCFGFILSRVPSPKLLETIPY